MKEMVYILSGGIVAIAIDWAIYTHLSAYIRLAFPNSEDRSYREMSFGRPVAIVRTMVVFLSGLACGLALTMKYPLLWLVTFGLFAFTHSLIYALLYRRGGQP